MFFLGLKKELLKAQENGDVLEESKVCNVLGEEYSKLGIGVYSSES